MLSILIYAKCFLDEFNCWNIGNTALPIAIIKEQIRMVML
jgi:hypothetical protein